MGFFGDVREYWRAIGAKTENDQDPSQVEAPTEDEVRLAVVVADNNYSSSFEDGV
jgi:hypothetical protein